MNELEKLRRALEEVLNRIEKLNQSVRDGDKFRNFTEDEQRNYDGLKADVERIRGAIKREEDLLEARAEVERLEDVKPARVEIVREHNTDKDGNYRGFSELGKGGFGQFLQAVQRVASGRGEDKRLGEMRAILGANEGVGAEGGYMLQSDHAEQLFSNVIEAGVLASDCTPVNMSTNSTSVTLLDETSVAVGSQFGGCQAYWRAEGASVNATKPKLREVNVKAEALEALFYATEEQLEDAPQLESFANLAFSTCMAYQLDDAIYAGNGAGKPLGIINSPVTITVAKENGQTADTFVYANADNMVDRLLVGSEGKAKWYIHPNVRKQLRNMVITPATKTDFMPFLPAGGISGQQYDTLFGSPIKRTQVCRDLGDKGDVLYGDLSKYLLFIRKGVQASQSMHVAFLTSQRAFKWTLRANGMSLMNSAVTDANGSTTRSPFIVCAARA